MSRWLTDSRSQAQIPTTSPNGKSSGDFNKLWSQRRLLHNHPSGDPTPSKADIEMTREVAKAARTLGIELHDHLIIGRGRQTSLRGLGLI